MGNLLNELIWFPLWGFQFLGVLSPALADMHKRFNSVAGPQADKNESHPHSGTWDLSLASAPFFVTTHFLHERKTRANLSSPFVSGDKETFQMAIALEREP